MGSVTTYYDVCRLGTMGQQWQGLGRQGIGKAYRPSVRARAVMGFQAHNLAVIGIVAGRQVYQPCRSISVAECNRQSSQLFSWCTPSILVITHILSYQH
jgi:hypothetical protein